MDPQLEEILKKYNEAPQSLLDDPKPAPFALSVGGSQYNVNSPQEAQQLLDASMTNAANINQQLQAERDRLQARLAELESKPAPKVVDDTPKPLYDPMTAVADLGTDPSSFLLNAIDKDPRIAEKLVERAPQFQHLREHSELQKFSNAHPIYGNIPQVMQGLKNILQSQNQPVTANNLEMAAGWAVYNGHLMHENQIRMQQQQVLRQQMGQNQPPPQPQIDDWGNPLPPSQPQNNYPQNYGQVNAPPMIGGGRTNGESVESRITRMFNDKKLSTEEMRKVLQSLENPNNMSF